VWFLLLVELESNPLLQNIVGAFSKKVPSGNSRQVPNKYTLEYFNSGSNILVTLFPLVFEAGLLCLQLLLLRLLLLLYWLLQPRQPRQRKRDLLVLVAFASLEMLSCSRVELMVGVLAQMCLLSYAMAPYLMLALAFLGLLVSVTVLVVHQASKAGATWSMQILILLRESRYILYPGMLMLTEQPYTQLALIIFCNLLATFLSLRVLLLDHARHRFSALYGLIEALGMLLIEVYMLVNQHLPLGIDYFMIILMVFMVSLYMFVSLRLLFFRIRKFCLEIGKWLKDKRKKLISKTRIESIVSRKNINIKRFSL
jgi:hypothetical protein